MICPIEQFLSEQTQNPASLETASIAMVTESVSACFFVFEVLFSCKQVQLDLGALLKDIQTKSY